MRPSIRPQILHLIKDVICIAFKIVVLRRSRYDSCISARYADIGYIYNV